MDGPWRPGRMQPPLPHHPPGAIQATEYQWWVLLGIPGASAPVYFRLLSQIIDTDEGV